MKAVVTGTGVIAPNGLGTTAYWSATLEGRSGIARISRFDPSSYPVRLAGEVRDFDAGREIPSRLRVQTDRWTHLGLAAAEMALADAGVDPERLDEYEKAVVTASSLGGAEFGQREIESLWDKGPQFVTAYQSIAWFYAATTGQLSIRHGMRGPCGVIVTEQAGGIDAVAQARRVLDQGAQLVVTGGTEAPLCPYALVCQITSGLLSRVEDPARAYLPFDANASGCIPGEGGAILIVENQQAALARGARPYACVAGYAATFDPGPHAPPGEREPGLRRAIELALADAGRDVCDIDVVFADAAGVPWFDLQEATALSAVFGPRRVPVTAPKTMTGRLYAGGAAMDVAAAALSIRDFVIPPTIGVTDLAYGCDLDLVRTARAGPIRSALVVARGYGGFNAALVLTATT